MQAAGLAGPIAAATVNVASRSMRALGATAAASNALAG